MSRKGRVPRVTENHITTVKAISALNPDASYRTIANAVGLGESTVSDIIRGLYDGDNPRRIRVDAQMSPDGYCKKYGIEPADNCPDGYHTAATKHMLDRMAKTQMEIVVGPIQLHEEE